MIMISVLRINNFNVLAYLPYIIVYYITLSKMLVAQMNGPILKIDLSRDGDRPISYSS